MTTGSATADTLLAGLLTLFVICVLWYWLRPMYRSRKYEREARRFQQHPLPGDRAGYIVHGDTWMVGKVVEESRNLVESNDRRYVVLRMPINTPMGEQTIDNGWWIDELTYFPPDTPLGLHERKPKV